MKNMRVWTVHFCFLHPPIAPPSFYSIHLLSKVSFIAHIHTRTQFYFKFGRFLCEQKYIHWEDLSAKEDTEIIPPIKMERATMATAVAATGGGGGGLCNKYYVELHAVYMTIYTLSILFLDSYKRELFSLRRIKYRYRAGKYELYFYAYIYSTNNWMLVVRFGLLRNIYI